MRGMQRSGRRAKRRLRRMEAFIPIVITRRGFRIECVRRVRYIVTAERRSTGLRRGSIAFVLASGVFVSGSVRRVQHSSAARRC